MSRVTRSVRRARRSRALPLAAALAASAAVGLLAGASPASASRILYQCGGNVCTVDPNTSAAPITVGTGTVAGITRDGRTAAWVTGNQLVERPLESGGLNQTLFQGEIYDFPAISPDGTQALWTFFYNGYGWYEYRAPGTGTGYPPAVASSTYQTTHGWLGSTPLVARRGSGSVPPRICAEVVGGPACDQQLATEPDTSTQVSFPSGSPDGQYVVAVRGPESTGFGQPYSGRISIYSVASGTRVRDLTTGPDDAHPAFSNEGDRVTFERDGKIFVVPLSTGVVRELATGTQPFWGGARTVVPPPDTPPTTPAPPMPPTTPTTPTSPTTPMTPTTPGSSAAGPGTGTGAGATANRTARGAAVASTILRYRRGRILVTVRCSGSSTCSGTVRVSKGTSVLSTRSYRVAKGTKKTIALKPTARGVRLLARSRTGTLTVRLKAKQGDAVTRSLAFRR